MKKFIIVIMTLFMLNTAAQAEWVQIDLKKKPYYDPRNGKVVNPEGRRNRPNIDPFTGGGHEYPALDEERITGWHQKDTLLLIKTDAPVEGKKLTDIEAEQIRKEVFGLDFKPESGVTK